MDERRKISEQQKDSFWDLSDLIPQRSRSAGAERPIRTTELELSVPESARDRKDPLAEDSSETVLKRYIPPHSDNRLSHRNEFESSICYTPADSLIHKVTLKKRKCGYRYYSEFLEDALRYQARKGTPCEYVPFFSYVPQYSQMNEAQRAYYFWFREVFQAGSDIKVDYSYVLLYVYELINLGNASNAERSRDRLIELWETYHETFPGLSGRLGEWICDFSLLHRLPPPERGNPELVKKVPSLKEFYISMPTRDPDRCARSLLKYCTSYDYRKSKFAQGERRALFDRHVVEALRRVICQYSEDGMLLSGIRLEDSTLVRDAYAGALCTAEQRYRIEVEYCSFSRSNELRFLVGDIVKYSENKLRACWGIKSKMTVYAISAELRDILDAYFSQALPLHCARKQTEKQAYEALYEIPKMPLSLNHAARIEEESWETTRNLVETFTQEQDEISQGAFYEPVAKVYSPSKEVSETDDLRCRLCNYFDVVCRLTEGDGAAVSRAARAMGKMPDALADEINEVAYEVIGDTLIEDAGEGYCVIEEYRELIEQLRKGEKQNGSE